MNRVVESGLLNGVGAADAGLPHPRSRECAAEPRSSVGNASTSSINQRSTAPSTPQYVLCSFFAPLELDHPGPTMTPEPESIDSEPTPFPEALEHHEPTPAEVHDLDEALRTQLHSITATDPNETSLYYDASSMAPLSPISAVSLSNMVAADAVG